MKTIVKGAILALLAVALTGAAEARYVTNNTANSTFVIGETNASFGVASPTIGGSMPTGCTAGTMGGVVNTNTQSVGNKTIGANIDTTGLGLVAGPYDVTCTAPVTAGYIPVTFRVSAVDPTYTVTLKAMNKSTYYTNEISSVASGDSITINTTNNLNDYINLVANPAAEGGTACAVSLEMRLSGETSNRLNILPSSWVSNTTDIGAGWNGDSYSRATTLALYPTLSWPAGTYEFKQKPSSSSCNGLGTASAVLKSLTVTTSGVSMTVDKSTASLSDVVTFSGKTSPFANITIQVSSGTADNIRVNSYDAQKINGSTDNATGELRGLNMVNFWCPTACFADGTTAVTAKSDGTFALLTTFVADGSYELKATVVDATGATQEAKQSLTVKPVSATVKTSKTTAYLGQDVDITGTVTAGSKVFIAINNKLETNTTVQADKTFKYTWSNARTQKFSEGSVNVDVWVCPSTIMGASTADCGNASQVYQAADTGVNSATDTKDGICKDNLAAGGGPASGGIWFGCDKSNKKSADASWSVSMKDQTVTVTSPTSGQQIAQGEKFHVTGTAPAAQNSKVNVWIFNSQGTTTGGTCYAATVAVSSEESGFVFDKELGKSEVTQDTGDYTMVAQSLGRDGIYSDGSQISSTAANKAAGVREVGLHPADSTTAANVNLGCNDDASVTGSTLGNKIGSQISSILQDNALSKAGSDDQKVYKVVQFKVVAPSTKLNACPAAVKGSNLNVTGTTNRADGTTIIVKAVGPKELPPVTTTATNGTYTATFTAAAIGADVGTYTVTADDLKGVTDTVTCSVIAGTPCSLSVAVKSSKTQVEKDEKAALTATVSNSGDETCTATTLTSTVNPSAGATVTWAKTSTDVPAKGSADVMGNFSASADSSYTVSVTATRGAATANGTATIGVGKVAAATPGPTGAATPAPTGTAAPTATPKPSPGFEAVFAIAGLLAVAYLVNRRKR